MKTKLLMMTLCVVVLSSLTAYGQMIKRTDAIWARTTTSPITLDGKLTEAAWATAESILVNYGQSSGMPGGGWVDETGRGTPTVPTDPTNATFKFLVKGDSLYVGVIARDKSIGGGLFNQFDGFLMNVRYKSPTGDFGTPDRPGNYPAAFEVFYGWVTEGWADTTTGFKGASPGFFGWAGNAQYQPRTDSLKAIWDAASWVQGVTNDDTSGVDTAWTTEFKINLATFGYTPQNPSGELVSWSASLYDSDYEWPIDTTKLSRNRVWIQCPWSNTSAYGHLNIFVRPDVTPSSGAVPAIAADYTVPDAKVYPAPALDGKLTDLVWKYAPSIQIKYGDANIRRGYKNAGPYRSGQTQASVNGGKAAVIDANLATVKYFFLADTLFLGFDVNDKFVQFFDSYDRWDGFRVTVNERDTLNGDHVLRTRLLSFIVGPGGATLLRDNFPADSSTGRASVMIALKGGTTVDTTGTSADTGYTAEMKIVLTKFGYPAGRGDGVVFLGVTHYDGDSFSPFTSSYGTRTWFMREGDFNDGPAWFYLDPATVLDVKSSGAGTPTEFALLGNYPNPFNPSTMIKFQMSHASEVTLDVYDVLGRLVSSRSLGVRNPGEHAVPFNASNLASGTYYFRLKMVSTGAIQVGKMMLLK